MKENKLTLIELEKRENNILDWQPTKWRMKDHTMWLKRGYENPKFFHNFTNHMKRVNTILEMQNVEDITLVSFLEIANLGVKYSQFISKNKLTTFPRFVSMKDNQMLMEDVLEKE